MAAAAWEYRLQIDEKARAAVSHIESRRDDPAPTPTLAPRIPALPLPTPDNKIIRLGRKAGLDVPAQAVTGWLEDPRFGRVSVHVPEGTTPREALTIALAERGFQVVR
jgi:hypothetical protein